jgi:hypothetical protein
VKIKLKIIPTPNGQVHEVSTNLLCIAEWEKQENRKVSDGRGIGVGDMVFWAHFMLKLSGQKIEATSKQWLDNHPDMEIEAVDQTNPNPTGAELTEGN